VLEWTRHARTSRTATASSQQGPLRRRALRDARAVRLLPHGGARHVHGAAVDAQRSPRPLRRSRASRRTRGRSATASVAVGCALAARLAGRRLPHLRRAGRRRDAGGSNWEAAMTAAHYGLGSLTGDRRPQPAAAGRADRGDQAARALRGNGGASASKCARSTATTTAAPARGHARPSSQPAAVAVIANTIKGKVRVVHRRTVVEWHHKVPDARAGQARPSRSSRA
jgi:hypothetical protein